MQNDRDSQAASTQSRQQAESDGAPKFGKLLIVLAFAVAIVVALTYGSMAYYSN
jgi:hypothetical protein